MLTRRAFLAAGSAATLSACAPAPLPDQPPISPAPPPALPAFYGAVTTEPFPVPAVPTGVVEPRLWRQFVPNPFPEDAPGTVVVDPGAGYLFLVGDDGQALRYGAGTGAAAYAWSGTARMQFTRAWPVWKAPDSMIARRPEFAPFSVANGGMPGGPGNPLGARALYLFQDGNDTLYRIHGACEPQLLGRAVSSGCIRLLDQDAIDIAARVPHGATVRVLPAAPPVGTGLY